MIKGNLGKMVWIESLKNEGGRDINAFDLVFMDGNVPSVIEEQRALLEFEEAVVEIAA
jgi:hypothetical protein